MHLGGTLSLASTDDCHLRHQIARASPLRRGGWGFRGKGHAGEAKAPPLPCTPRSSPVTAHNKVPLLPAAIAGLGRLHRGWLC